MTDLGSYSSTVPPYGKANALSPRYFVHNTVLQWCGGMVHWKKVLCALLFISTAHCKKSTALHCGSQQLNFMKFLCDISIKFHNCAELSWIIEAALKKNFHFIYALMKDKRKTWQYKCILCLFYTALKWLLHFSFFLKEIYWPLWHADCLQQGELIYVN